MVKIIEKTVTREIVLEPAKAGEEKKERILTVTRGKNKGSQITLVGLWLQEAGLNPGDMVRVKVNENRLVIEKLDADPHS